MKKAPSSGGASLTLPATSVEHAAPAAESQGQIIIRDACEADLPALEWDGEYTPYRKVFRHTFQETRHRRRIMLLAERQSQLVGQVFIQLGGRDIRFADGEQRAYLYSLRVKPTCQRLGIGSRLLRAAEQRLRSLGYSEAVIAAAKSNLAARRLYERMGYRVFDDDPGQWSYIDHRGRSRQVSEPCWLLIKSLLQDC